MARIITWRKVPQKAKRFEILNQSPEKLTMDVWDSYKQILYTIEAAGKVEYATMLMMNDVRWSTVIIMQISG